jgi:hypothetical protein
MQIEITKPWYYGVGMVDGRTPLLHAGTYLVPRDISHELAQRALAEGAAVEVKDAAPAPQPASPVQKKSTQPVKRKPSRGAGAAKQSS